MSPMPDAGDIVIIDFDPQAGHEQAGKRPALVLSPKQFNKITGFVWLCPITSQVKGYPFEVAVTGSKKTQGVILTDQLKSLDAQARRLQKVDQVNADCLANAKVLIATIISI
ncbi:growth inhibitor [Rheinheimera sp. A13L]|uniref:endoribonuclease MazF n=1 Tax=Rheinheimera sp. A13L TaxID=506534 RepID=UPI00021254C0|nr:endoribonuclease MazF [Rheinheimera sp. A13L]EGM77931.1 growth inhibitor [Rheinheimera sp. A13L]